MTNELHITRYQCATCGTVYDTESQAAACEARPIQPPLRVHRMPRLLQGRAMHPWRAGIEWPGSGSAPPWRGTD
jgi:hypothetical protein